MAPLLSGFLFKYHHDPSSKISLPHFIKKLQDKKQSIQQQKQASNAISLYHEIVLSHSSNHMSREKMRNPGSGLAL